MRYYNDNVATLGTVWSKSKSMYYNGTVVTLGPVCLVEFLLSEISNYRYKEVGEISCLVEYFDKILNSETPF